MEKQFSGKLLCLQVMSCIALYSFVQSILKVIEDRIQGHSALCSVAGKTTIVCVTCSEICD